MDGEWLSVGQVAGRSGFAASAIRYYEAEGLISAERNEWGAAAVPPERPSPAGLHQRRPAFGGEPGRM